MTESQAFPLVFSIFVSSISAEGSSNLSDDLLFHVYFVKPHVDAHRVNTIVTKCFDNISSNRIRPRIVPSPCLTRPFSEYSDLCYVIRTESGAYVDFSYTFIGMMQVFYWVFR